MLSKKNEELDLENIIQMLKSQRYQIDDTLQELTGNRFDESLFDADSLNGMIQAKFSDIATQLNQGALDQAYEWAKEGAEKEWLKIT